MWKRSGVMRYSHGGVFLRHAEAMMRGDHSDILWRKVEEDVRSLIWC